MVLLQRQDVIVKRGPDNEVLPELVSIEKEDGELIGEVKMTPLTIGEMFKIEKETKGNLDEAASSKVVLGILAQHLVEPKMTEVELLEMKIGYVKPFVSALMKLSGQDEKKAFAPALTK